jgi:hypothetical protein
MTAHPDDSPELALEAMQLRECLDKGIERVTPNQQELLRSTSRRWLRICAAS